MRDIPQFQVCNTRINSLETATFLHELAPDVILTSGCPILRPRIFKLPRLATINVHWGITPAYRGENTLFWPLYFEDFSRVGVTIHQIDEGIDTGMILARGLPPLSGADTEASVTAKCAGVAIELLHDVLSTIEVTQSVNGIMPATGGKLFLERHRLLHHDALYWIRRRVLRRQLAETEARSRVYISDVCVGRSLNSEDDSWDTASDPTRASPPKTES